MIRFVVAALAASALAGCSILPEEPPPPPCNVSVDGQLNVAEWQGAQRIDLSGGVVLWMIQGPAHLCMAVETREAGRRDVDILISDSAGAIHNLRAGDQVGERVLSGTRWTADNPATNWGQTTGWGANAASADPAAYEGYEFVIERAPLPRPWRMRVEVSDPEGDARDSVWPAQSRRNDIRSWALLP